MSRTFDRDTLQGEYEDAFFRLVMADHAKAQGAIFVRENEELKKDPDNNPTPLQIQKFRRTINKAFRKRTVKSALTKTRRAFTKAAVIAAILVVGIFTSAITVQAIRVNVLNFLIGFEEEYASLQIGAAGGNSIIGDNLYVSWADAYVPSYIPDGFKITKLTNTPELKSINYLHSDGRTIFYYEYSAMYEVNMDTEDAERVENASINGLEALLVQKGVTVSLAWENDSKLFVISAEVSEEELFKIAEGVRFISVP
jgi:hypothetical protein